MKSKTKRKYKQADDSMFLYRLRQRTLRVDVETQRAYKRARPGLEWQELKTFEGRHGYLYIRCHLHGARKAIALSRLIWMSVNDQCVPDGYDIDHIDHNRLNNHPSNLRLRDSSENRSDQSGDQTPWEEDF